MAATIATGIVVGHVSAGGIVHIKARTDIAVGGAAIDVQAVSKCVCAAAVTVQGGCAHGDVGYRLAGGGLGDEAVARITGAGIPTEGHMVTPRRFESAAARIQRASASDRGIRPATPIAIMVKTTAAATVNITVCNAQVVLTATINSVGSGAIILNVVDRIIVSATIRSCKMDSNAPAAPAIQPEVPNSHIV